MLRRMRRAAGVVGLVLGVLLGSMGGATAQPSACDMQSPAYPGDFPLWRYLMGSYYGDHGLLQAQTEEVRRIGDNPYVVRYLDRLYLKVGGYKVATFVDCPVNKSALYYLYRHDDEIGDFYVLEKAVHEDLPHYLLVSKRDGSSIEVFGLPVWSPDKSRFVAGGCAGRGTMSIIGLARDELRPEGKFELPCDVAECKLAWENPTTVRAACGSRTLRATGRETSWSVVPGSDPGSPRPGP
jgi:hypothetical protein